MLMNLLFGLSTMMACLLLQSVLVIAAIRHYRRRESWLNHPSFWSSVAVITGVMLIRDSGRPLSVDRRRHRDRELRR
jgi:hypothetical protein